MPAENLASSALLATEGSRYSLTDTPFHHGMLAVMRELSDQDLSEEQKMSVTFRLMHFRQIFSAKELEPFLRQGRSSDEIEVPAALIKACATAPMVHDGDKLHFDFAEMAAIARRLIDEGTA